MSFEKPEGHFGPENSFICPETHFSLTPGGATAPPWPPRKYAYDWVPESILSSGEYALARPSPPPINWDEF